MVATNDLDDNECSTYVSRLSRVTILIISIHPRFDVRQDLDSQGVSSPRCYRGCKISAANCGGVTHFALTTDDDGSVMTVAYGQNAANGTKVSSGRIELEDPHCDLR